MTTGPQERGEQWHQHAAETTYGDLMILETSRVQNCCHGCSQAPGTSRQSWNIASARSQHWTILDGSPMPMDL